MLCRKTSIALSLLSFLSTPALALNGTWVETEGKAEFTGNLTLEQVQMKALNNARSKAIEQVTGIDVSDVAYFGRSGEGALKLFRETKAVTSGRVIEEKALSNTVESIPLKANEPPITFYKVRLKACVAKDNPPDPNFKVTLSLNQKNFNAGSSLKMNITSSQDAILSIFNLAADDKVYLVYPNRYRPELNIVKNNSLELPKADDAFSIKPAPLEGHDQDVEAVKVVATRTKIEPPPLDEKKGSLSMADFYRWLLSIPAVDRAEATEEYSLHK